MAGLVNGGTILEGRLILSLDSGEILDLGYVQGPTGLTGPQGPMGSTGRPGRDGNTLLHGVGTPTTNDGKDGDFFYSTDKVAIYGPRSGGTWGKPVYLRPQDNKSFTLPTGMKAQGGAAGARAFAAGISGPSSGGAIVSGGSGGLTKIDGHDDPLAAGVWTPVATDQSGDAMIVDLQGEAAGGALMVEVALTRDLAKRTGYSVVYEIQTGVPPALTFRAVNNANDKLQLEVQSSVPLVKLRGRILYI